MAQDISDVIAFVHQYCDVYCMDKVLLHVLIHNSVLESDVFGISKLK